MRLIDAIAYRKVLNEEMDYRPEHCKDSFKYRCGLEIAIADLGDMPAIDAVPVVRCKDCKHGWKNCATGNIYCQRDGRNSYEMIFKPDDFCSYGVQKDGER